eukprot:1161140-Pelagomonas_calceolata.AAC.13
MDSRQQVRAPHGGTRMGGSRCRETTWTADSRSGRLMEAHDWEGQGAERQHGQQTADQGASWRHMIGRVMVQRDNMDSRQQVRVPHGGT